MSTPRWLRPSPVVIVESMRRNGTVRGVRKLRGGFSAADRMTLQQCAPVVQAVNKERRHPSRRHGHN